MKKILSLPSWAKMTNLAGRWMHTPKWYITTWRVLGRTRECLMNWRTWAGGEAAVYFGESGMTYGKIKLNVLAVAKPLTAITASTPSQTIFGELLLTLQIIYTQSQMQHETSRLGASQMRWGLEKPLTLKCTGSPLPNVVPELWLMANEKPVEHVCIAHCT